MPASTTREVGERIAATRRAHRMTQQDLANAAFVSLSMLRKIEQGSRFPGDDTLDALAAALTVDPGRLLTGHQRTDSRVHEALPAVSVAIAAHEDPDDGPVRPLHELEQAVDDAVDWRLAAQYVQISRNVPSLLMELARAFHTTPANDRAHVASLLVRAYRCADAMAYKFGASDLSARLIGLMRETAAEADDPLLEASVAYVRTEMFFAARAHRPGLRALEKAIDVAPAPASASTAAARGALHMRAAVVASRAGDPDATSTHLNEATRLGDLVPEDVYLGTAFGPDSVRVHQVSVAVGLGDDHVQDALDVASQWKPPDSLPAERRSGFYIELGRAQLWAGLADDAFESLKVARRIAPQHTRGHRWAREDAATLRRLKRADSESLTSFAEWIGAV
ncbi:helix-turn-helix domain-containing protein [Streptomyces europaeiscabiei]|uniref:helix-turn-helix domain-containing protein n=1 Tax=Streptomyces europaeiscabiei TaxID=146819 RepID=UPI000765C357|nr:helix-turn-helix transcriptional regulator [Streptomyces europaeiscabiei]MDX3831408.1 helix-turn-helix transcriptional regulator [Streptomyces europaeiscabiei]